MANKGSSQPGDKSRFRVLLIEGDVLPGELQVFAQTLAAAIRPTAAAPLPPRNAPPAIQGPRLQAEEPGLVTGVIPEEVPDAGTDATEEPVTQPKPQNGNGSAKKKLRTPQLVSELEFTAGPKPLLDYIKEIDPKEHSKRYLAIVYWLREYRGISEVTGDHIYTAYRFLNLNVPKDVGSVLRALKGQEWLERGSRDGVYKITHIGENQLTKGSD